MKKFKLKQVATNVPPANVQDVKVLEFEDRIILVSTSEGWVRIDLNDQTFAVGANEG